MSNTPTDVQAALARAKTRAAGNRILLESKAWAYAAEMTDDVYLDAKNSTNPDVRRKAAEYMLDIIGGRAKPQAEDTSSLATINVVINGSSISAKAVPAPSVVDVDSRMVEDTTAGEPQPLDEPEHKNLLPPLSVDELPMDLNALMKDSEGLA